MKALYVFLAIMFGCFTSVLAQCNEEMLEQLDKAVNNRQHYVKQKENRISLLRKQLNEAPLQSKFEVASKLFEQYFNSDSDSARYYSNLCYQYAVQQKNAVQIQRALIFQERCYAISGLYDEADHILDEMQKDVFPENKLLYFSSLSELNIWKSDYSPIQAIRNDRLFRSRQARDSLLKYQQNPAWRKHFEAQLICDDNPRKAKDEIMKVMDTISLDNPDIRYFANTAGHVYGKLNMPDSVKYYLTISALSDIKQAVREHASLRQLAMILFKDGDINRAYNYMNCSIDDSQRCKARLRTLEAVGDMPIIMDAYQRMLHTQQNQLIIISIVLAVLLLFISIACVNIYIISKHLREARKVAIKANEELQLSNQQLELILQKEKDTNHKLLESNQIKETYVAKYMTECSDNIEKIETYRKTLQRIARNENTEALFNALKSTNLIEKELERFYEGFDKTFLGLFPTFVSDFNALLLEDERFEDEQKGLSTELRIFALIRLGITDSNEIAHFLRYSVKTIYNYRTKIRNKAIGNRDELEEKLKEIGLNRK